MEHDHVQGMDGESAAALLEGVITVMEPGELGNKGSAVDAGLVAAMLGAMDSSQVQDVITPEITADLAGKMEASDVALLDSDSAAAMMDSMGAGTAVEAMGQDSLATMIGVMDGQAITETLDSASAGAIAGALSQDNLQSRGA